MSFVYKIYAWFILLKFFNIETLCSYKSVEKNVKLFLYSSFSVFIEFTITFKEYKGITDS